jgi:hypothetical protein
MPSKWEVTVAKASGMNWNKTGPRYLHYFTTSSEHWTTEQVTALTNDLRSKLPIPEFEITVTRWECSGQNVVL